IATLNDARSRYLKPGGSIIPHAVEQFVAPVVCERYWRELSMWDEVGYGLDFAPAKVMSLNNIYVRLFAPGDLLDGGATAKAWDKVAFDRRNKTTRAGEAVWRISRPTTVYGLALWWRAEFIAGVELSTSPLEARTHWEQLYLP